MILILSDEDDFSTNEVIDWLLYYEQNVFRLNRTDHIRIQDLSIDSESGINFTLIINHKISVKSSEIRSYWYRRGFLKKDLTFVRSEKQDLDRQMNRFLEKETDSTYELLYRLLRKKHGFNNIHENDTNKAENLENAKKCKLTIPATLITTEKRVLQRFLKNYPKVITKAVHHGVSFSVDNCEFGGPTELFKDEYLKHLPERFALTLFQECIEKAYELRIFYLNGKCFPMVIFSQLDQQTAIDFRNYNDDKPNRTSVYKLPDAIENNIKKFMQSSKLKSGSIDMVVTQDKEFVFLEVNPIGQFWQTSKPTNFYLEKEIAKQLMEYGKTN